MHPLRTMGIVVAVVLGGAQLVRLPATNPPVRGDLIAPPEVKGSLRRGCYDCHSNETTWPWYSAVAPVAWIIRGDVNEGRRRLNFSDWADYESDPETAAQKLRQIAKSVGNGDMAPMYYRALHAGARLTPAQREAVRHWAEQEAVSHQPH